MHLVGAMRSDLRPKALIVDVAARFREALGRLAGKRQKVIIHMEQVCAVDLPQTFAQRGLSGASVAVDGDADKRLLIE